MIRVDNYRVNTQKHIMAQGLTYLSEQMFVCWGVLVLFTRWFLRITDVAQVQPHRWRRGSWGKRFVVEAGVWCWHMPVCVWVCLCTSNVRLGVDGAAYVWEDCVERHGYVCDLRSTSFLSDSVWLSVPCKTAASWYCSLTLICVLSQHYSLSSFGIMLCN